MTKILAGLAIAGAALSIAATAQAADMASPSAPAYSGIIEMFGGYSMLSGASSEFGDDRKNNPIFGGFSAVNLPLADGMSAQIDLSGNGTFTDNHTTDDDMVVGSLHTVGHLSVRDESTLFGGFGGVGRVAFHDENSGAYFFAGAEMQAYLSSTTLYLQGGYLDSTQAEDDNDDTLQEAFFARGVARFYATETSRFSTELAYAAGKTDGFYDSVNASILAWGARFDQQLSDSPASAFLAYSGANYRGGCDNYTDWYDHRVMVGVSFAFGGNSIMANDRQGVALDTPDFGSWVGASEMNQFENGCGNPT